MPAIALSREEVALPGLILPFFGQRGRCRGALHLRLCAHGSVDDRIRDTYNVRMELRFVWDEKKNHDNRRKHGVSFQEAQTAFYDENAKVYSDPDHSGDEARFLLLGLSFRLRTLVVCHCCREKDSVIRIISARKADKGEEKDYWG